MDRGPNAKVLGQGMATIAVVLIGRRLAGPTRRAMKKSRDVVHEVPRYAEFLREESVRRGLREGSTPWLAAATVLWGSRYLRRRRRRTSLVLREVLQPGERVFISQVPRREARAK